MPAISVIIPVYNVERWLDGCIKCVLDQTMQDFEVILVNDGSTDNSGEICNRYAAMDNRIKVIHKDNEGAGPTRTSGMKAAKGEYLYFPDSDDWFEPNMLADLYRLAKDHDADLVACNFVNVKYDAENREISRTIGVCRDILFSSQEDCRKNVMELFPTSTAFDVPWNKLYRRQVIVDNKLSFRKLRRCQDAVFNLDFYNCCRKVVTTARPYYYYRENTQALVWRKFPKEYIDIQVFYFQRLRELLTSWGIYDGWVKEHYDTSFVIAIIGCACMYDNPLWQLTKAERREFVKRCVCRQEVRDFLPTAMIRPDMVESYELIKRENVKKIMRQHRVELLKDRLRHNKMLRAAWRIMPKRNKA